MKKLLISLSVIAVAFTACNFSKGIQTNLTTGLTYSYNGFRIEKVEVFDNDMNPIKGKKHPEGTVLRIQLYNVEGYTIEDNTVFPVCSLKVTDREGKIVMQRDNIFEGYDGDRSVENFKTPSVMIGLSNPIFAGNEYKIEVHYFDQKNPKNAIDIDLDVEVTPSESNVKYTNNGLSASEIFLSGDKSTKVPHNKFKMGSSAYIVFRGLEGFTVENGKVFPGCEVTLISKGGETALQEDDILQKYTDGVPAEAASMLFAGASLNNPVEKGTYLMKVRIFDKKNATKEIKTETEIEVIE